MAPVIPGPVCVLGMHRSGTSAAIRLVASLGLSLGRPSDVMSEPTADAPVGHWENRLLTSFNEHLLFVLGGSWSGPPDLAEGWEAEQSLGDMRAEARHLLRRTFIQQPWAWKDPRLCVLLPFWRPMLPDSAVFVLLLRHPAEIAASLQRRNGFTEHLSLALWERYGRAALRNLTGERVLITSYDDLLTDPREWRDQVAALVGIDAVEGPTGGLVDTGLRHQHAADHPELTQEQRALWDASVGLRGLHAALELPDIGAESPYTGVLLAEQRRWYLEARERLDEQRDRLYAELEAERAKVRGEQALHAAALRRLEILEHEAAVLRKQVDDQTLELADAVDRLREIQGVLSRRAVRLALRGAEVTAPVYRLLRRRDG